MPLVEQIIQKLGAETVADLTLVDEDMAKEAVQDLKLIPRKKAMEVLLKVSANAPLPPTPVGASSTVSRTHSTEASTKASTKASTVDEAVAICIDHSYSMSSAFDEQKTWCDDGNENALKKTIDRRSRMDAVKQVFYAFRDRVDLLGRGKHEIGLIQFDDKVEKMLDLTSSLNLFEDIVDDIEQRGSTAIYSAILEGVRLLRPTFETSPHTDLRVLLLTDGQNNAGVDPVAALREANKIGAIVDAIVVGNCPDENLRKIVAATGGSCFQIKSLSEGFELMESEAVVSLRARRGGTDKPPFVEREMPAGGFTAIQAQKLTSASKAGTVAQQATTIAKKLVPCHAVVSSNSGVSKGNRRVMKEIVDMQREGCLVFPDEDNYHLMKALITGPAGSPFEHGTFVLNINIPTSYPMAPPRVLFETPVYHCNVSGGGEICLNILRESWSPALTISKVMMAIQLMLASPDTDNALRQWIAELTLMNRQSHGKDTRYVDEAVAATTANASRSVDEWKVHWGLN
jgi:ubiquitin-conjugating enzyme E2 D/E